MKILNHLKHVAIAVLPITIALVIVDLFLFDIGNVWHILGGGFVLMVGETLFLLVVDGSVVRMGEIVATKGKSKKGIFLVLAFALIFGLLTALAEPDIQVLANQVLGADIPISKILFVVAIGVGIGVFCVIGLARTALGIPTWAVMLLFYSAVIVMAILVVPQKTAIAFDASSASTGVIAAPFLIALCSGLSAGSRRKSKEGDFGLIGVSSIGPVFAVLCYFLFAKASGDSGSFLDFNTGNMLLDTLVSVGLAVVPMMLVFFVFELCFLRVSKRDNLQIVLSMLFMSIGLFLMIFGLELGFAKAGNSLGNVLGEKNLWWLVLIFGVVFGFCMPFAEPAIRVLGSRVEDATNGNIKAKFVVFAIAFSMIISTIISLLMVVLNWNVAYVLIAIVGVSLVLMFFSPQVFVAIAFDSGGVALGPTATAFLFPMVVGLAGAMGASASFGTLAVLGLVPIVVMEVLGIAFAVRTKSDTLIRSVTFRRKRASSGVDKYSDIAELEKLVDEKYGGDEQ